LKREILVTATQHESWVALLEDKKLVELMFDRPDQDRIVGDIFLGRVEAVLPGIQAAFVDIGTEKAGFLHVSDIYRGDESDDDSGNGNGNGNGRKGKGEKDGKNEKDGGRGGNRGGGRGGRGRRPQKYPPITDLIQKGQTILVQATKEPISTKGPRITAQISMPGRFLVFMPDSDHVGVSRKIDDRGERSRLRKLAKEVLPKNSGGVIVRTVGEELTADTFGKEFKRLHSNWKQIQKRAGQVKAPARVHSDAKLISSVIRDLFSSRFESVTVDSKAVYNEILQYVENVAPDLKDRIKFHEDAVSLFDKHGIEEEVQKAFEKKAMLASGGYLIIEPTEALVSIDVNTGRFTGKRDPEQTILKTNLDAAKEIAKQLRLRDIGGIVVCDFIDMNSQANRDKVLQELRSNLGRDRARTKAFEISSLGLIEMTRQRVRPSLYNSLTHECTFCAGSGRVYTPATVVRQIERTLRRAASRESEKSIMLRVHPEVALRIMEEEPDFLKRVAKRTSIRLALRDDPLLREDEFRLLSGPAETDVTSRYLAA
jgi:ribonuclease G